MGNCTTGLRTDSAACTAPPKEENNVTPNVRLEVKALAVVFALNMGQILMLLADNQEANLPLQTAQRSVRGTSVNFIPFCYSLYEKLSITCKVMVYSLRGIWSLRSCHAAGGPACSSFFDRCTGMNGTWKRKGLL